MSRASRHWRNQRISSVALVPLGIWFLAGLLGLPDAGYASARDWLSQPLTALLAALFALTAIWHSLQGLQVVVEDYVGGRRQRATLLVLRVLHAFAALAAAVAIAVIAWPVGP